MKKFRIVYDPACDHRFGDYVIEQYKIFRWVGTHRCDTVDECKFLIKYLKSLPKKGEVVYCE